MLYQSKYWSSMSIKTLLPGMSRIHYLIFTANGKQNLCGPKRISQGCMVRFQFPSVYGNWQATNLDVIRIYQSKTLADKHSMYELAVMRAKERQSKSFEDQVLARYVFSWRPLSSANLLQSWLPGERYISPYNTWSVCRCEDAITLNPSLDTNLPSPQVSAQPNDDRFINLHDAFLVSAPQQ